MTAKKRPARTTPQTSIGKYSPRLGNQQRFGFHENFRSDPTFFMQLIESLEDYAVFTTDTKGTISSWNTGAKKLLGYTENQIIGKNAKVFYIKKDIEKDAHTRELQLAEKHGKAMNERWHVRRDGSTFWGSGLVFPLRDDRGMLRGFTKVMRDLTERRSGIRQLEQSEERYRAFVANSTEGIWRFELERPIKISLPVKKQIDYFYEYAYLAECNDIVAKMYGYKKAKDIIGWRLNTFLIRENKQNIDYLTAFITSNYRLSEVESQEKDAHGELKFFLNNLVGIVDNGYLIRAWGTQRDITEQKTTEVHLKQLAEIVEYSDDSIIRRKLDGTVLSWNKGAENMYGIPAKDILGKDVKATIPKHLQHEADEISQKIINGEHINHFETTRMKKDGSKIDISLSVSAIKDVTGTITGISAIARDITDRKKIQQQKDEFIGIASHELKTPVTSIKAYLQVIKRRFQKTEDKTSIELLQKMDSQLNKLTDLIRDLLDVTKIESGRLQFTNRVYDFNKLTEEIVEEMQRTTTDHTIHVSYGKRKRVIGDRDRIGQVMINLISNAIKYSPKADKIIVKSSFNKDMVKLCVIDDGVGIPKDRQEKIFERYFRVSGPDNSSFPGMGLGLYISSEIIKRQGGRIWVESRKGEGSTFCFELPLKQLSKRPKKNI